MGVLTESVFGSIINSYGLTLDRFPLLRLFRFSSYSAFSGSSRSSSYHAATAFYAVTLFPLLTLV
jgi:hypothetical protein